MVNTWKYAKCILLQYIISMFSYGIYILTYTQIYPKFNYKMKFLKTFRILKNSNAFINYLTIILWFSRVLMYFLQLTCQNATFHMRLLLNWLCLVCLDTAESQSLITPQEKSLNSKIELNFTAEEIYIFFCFYCNIKF